MKKPVCKRQKTLGLLLFFGFVVWGGVLLSSLGYGLALQAGLFSSQNTDVFAGVPSPTRDTPAISAKRHAIGAGVLVYLGILAFLLYLIKRRLWRHYPHPRTRDSRSNKE